MKMVDKELLSRKLSKLREYLTELRKSTDITWEKYQADVRSKAFVERYLHLATELVLDIGNHIISFYQWREPTGYRDIFLVLSEHGIINHSEVNIYQNMASFRNMLVHRYEKIEDEVVFGIFQRDLKDFDTFILRIREWSDRHAEGYKGEPNEL